MALSRKGQILGKPKPKFMNSGYLGYFLTLGGDQEEKLFLFSTAHQARIKFFIKMFYVSAYMIYCSSCVLVPHGPDKDGAYVYPLDTLRTGHMVRMLPSGIHHSGMLCLNWLPGVYNQETM